MARVHTPRPRADHGRVRWPGVALAAATVLAIAATAWGAQRALDGAGTVSAGDGDRPASESVSSTSTVPDGPSTTAAGDPDARTSDPSGDPGPSTEPPVTTTPPASDPSTTTTTTPPPTTSTTAPPDPSLRRGSEGPEVAALQQRLSDLGYFVPVVDGRYGELTSQAVLAFQKAAGIGRDGIAGPNTLAALETATPVGPREGGDHIEIDLERQLLLLVRGERTLVFNTSTGRDGWRTPPGRFTITREIDGMRDAPLGQLWRPKYFNGGIAIHGSPSVPGYPASHGCARVHDDVIDMIWDDDLAPIGTPVWVY